MNQKIITLKNINNIIHKVEAKKTDFLLKIKKTKMIK